MEHARTQSLLCVLLLCILSKFSVNQSIRIMNHELRLTTLDSVTVTPETYLSKKNKKKLVIRRERVCSH